MVVGAKLRQIQIPFDIHDQMDFMTDIYEKFTDESENLWCQA